MVTFTEQSYRCQGLVTGLLWSKGGTPGPKELTAPGPRGLCCFQQGWEEPRGGLTQDKKTC